MRMLVLPPNDYLGNPNPCRLHHIFEQFPAFGDEIFVMRFSLRDKIVRKSNANVFSIRDVKFKSLPAYYIMNSGVFAKSSMEIIERYDIDVVIFANLYPPYVVSKTIHARCEGLLSVVDLLDHYPAIAAENAPRIIPKRFVDSVFSSMMKSVFRNSDSTIACSFALAKYARESGARDVHRIPNGVEEYFFWDYEKEGIQLRHKFRVQDSDLLMCFVGNLEYWLDMENLLQAMYMVKKNAKKRIKFLIVGGKLSTNFVNAMENQVRALSLEENVIRVGFISHSEVPKYIAASDICVSPKNIRDPVSYYSSPVKVWEYMAQGKPVISTSVPEIVATASECVSIANTSAEYFSCIMSFLEDPSCFLERAKKGKKLVEEYTWKKIAVTYRELLMNLSGHARTDQVY